MEHYDIFISYRKECSGDKPEMLQLMLEENGFRGRVSFDKDNLNGQFDVELLRRIDECSDFLMLILPDTFNNIDATDDAATTFYTELSMLPVDEFPLRLRQLPDEEKIDFVRIELGRALRRAEAGKLNIVPITLFESKTYQFSSLKLPSDLAALTRFQAVFFSDSREARFKDILPDLCKKLQARQHHLNLNRRWRKTTAATAGAAAIIGGAVLTKHVLSHRKNKGQRGRRGV